MRILFVNQFYWPDRAGASRLLTDVTRRLAALGHEVTVICGAPAVAMDCSARPPVTIAQASNLAFSRRPLRRLASYASFFTFAVVRSFMSRRPDLVVTLTTPPLLSLLGNLLRVARRTRHVIWEMDMYPDVAIDTGLLEPRDLLTRFLLRLSRWSRRRADRIIALGACMRSRLIADGISEDKVVAVENWADEEQIAASELPPQAPLEILYAGNLGMAHDTDTLWEAMSTGNTAAAIRFRFVGSGVKMAQLQRLCRSHGIINAVFEPFQTSLNLARLYMSAHIGLVTQRQSCVGSVVPSKIYEYLAAARPLLYIGPKNSTAALTIARYGCGWQIDTGDVDGLKRILDYLSRNFDEIQRAGQRGYEGFLRHHNISAGTERLIEALGVQDGPASGPAVTRAAVMNA
jgi:colanic acid biosynthesis glycosyl transferase WcaI